MSDGEIPFGLKMTCRWCPVQIEGPVDGGYVYFHARGGYWNIAIGANQDEAVAAILDDVDEPRRFCGEIDLNPTGEECFDLIREHLPKLRLKQAVKQ